jgi:DNA-binding beta-propeller fold protein YncE
MFVNSREEELEVEERLGSLRRGKGLAVMITMMVEEADAQQVVPGLPASADKVVEEIGPEEADELYCVSCAAFVPSHPDWLVTADLILNKIMIINTQTGALVCKLGDGPVGPGSDGAGQFNCPSGIAITSDSSYVLVVDTSNQRVQVLRLVVGENNDSAHLEFASFIGHQHFARQDDEDEDGQLRLPTNIALLPGKGGQETLLVTAYDHFVTEFALDGTLIRTFAGTGTRGSGDGEFDTPLSIAVLGSSGEVAIADSKNHRIQIFDSEGNYKRQFGSKGKEDGHFDRPKSLASDAHGNLLVTDQTSRLQVFDPKGAHLCTRSDLGITDSDHESRAIAWSTDGCIAIANEASIRIWHARA